MENNTAPREHRPVQTRVIAGTLYARSVNPSAYEIRVHELGHGNVEATIFPSYAWGEVDSLSQFALADFAEASQGQIWSGGEWVPFVPTEKEKLEKLTRNRERSCRRARTKVRRLCIHKSLSTLLTLTYQENMQDRARMCRDLDVFIKRVRRVIPDFQYLGVLEKQKRGAYHAHLAVPRILSHYWKGGTLVRSYDLLRSMWRGVIGAGGNIDVARSKKVGRSCARLARYLSKYIGKDIGVDSEGDSYRASGRALPAAVVFRSPSAGQAFTDLLDLIAADIAPGGDFYTASLDCGGYFASVSPVP